MEELHRMVFVENLIELSNEMKRLLPKTRGYCKLSEKIKAEELNIYIEGFQYTKGKLQAHCTYYLIQGNPSKDIDMLYLSDEEIKSINFIADNGKGLEFAEPRDRERFLNLCLLESEKPEVLKFS